jgi:branched-chain amino acid transport system ATP-binding protein
VSELLRIDGLHAGYGDSVVLEGLDLAIDQGEVVALLGANGAGKTTAMRAITGLITPTAGAVTFDGTDLLRVPPEKRVEAGVALCPEGRQVFPNMSVMENLLLGSHCRHARAQRERTLERVDQLFPRLAERRAQKAGLMSGGEQQMLAIGRALMACPRLLLLDEPSLGLSPKMVQLVFAAVAAIAAEGISILIVEQNAQAAFSVARRGYVLTQGRVAASGEIADLTRSGVVEQSFMSAAPDWTRGAACSPSAT